MAPMETMVPYLPAISGLALVAQYRDHSHGDGDQASATGSSSWLPHHYELSQPPW